MDYSRKISERMWNQPDKGELEAEREQTFIDDIVQKSHIEKELLAHLDGVETAFDAPISYTYPNQEKVISELVRIARKRIMISVSSRLGSLPYLSNPIQKNQFILDENSKDGWVQWCIQAREQMIDGFSFKKDNLMEAFETGLMCDVEETKQAYERGETPWVITYHFMPDELEYILKRNGVKDIVMAGPGAFARTIPNEILVKIMNDPEQKEGFLEFCHMYDSNPYVCGMGKDNLFARGEL